MTITQCPFCGGSRTQQTVKSIKAARYICLDCARHYSGKTARIQAIHNAVEQRVAQGLTCAQIARDLDLPWHTTHYYVRRAKKVTKRC